jgi:hypothetical protein
MDLFGLWCGEEECCGSKLTNGCFKKTRQMHQLHVLCCFVIYPLEVWPLEHVHGGISSDQVFFSFLIFPSFVR